MNLKTTLAALTLAALSPLAQAQADPVQVRSWAASCSGCHGTGGRALPGMVSLAGADKDAMVKTMQDFKSGKRPATIMHQLSKGYTDQQIELIAGYFAAQKPQK